MYTHNINVNMWVDVPVWSFFAVQLDKHKNPESVDITAFEVVVDKWTAKKHIPPQKKTKKTKNP